MNSTIKSILTDVDNVLTNGWCGKTCLFHDLVDFVYENNSFLKFPNQDLKNDFVEDFEDLKFELDNGLKDLDLVSKIVNNIYSANNQSQLQLG